MKYRITTQRQLRREFWATFPDLSRRKIGRHGETRDYMADTRMAWCDWTDSMERDGQISEALAFRATL